MEIESTFFFDMYIPKYLNIYIFSDMEEYTQLKLLEMKSKKIYTVKNRNNKFLLHQRKLSCMMNESLEN